LLERGQVGEARESGAAPLGLTQSAVVRKLKKYGLVVGDSTDEPPSRPGRTSPSSRD